MLSGSALCKVSRALESRFSEDSSRP
jgi:hypothetical protein